MTKIVQDSLGFLWLGTTDGLNRFDGQNFVVYRNIAGDSTSLPNNIINDLCVDAKDRVWVATNGGLCYYTFSDDIFHLVEFNDTLEKIDRHRIHAVALASEDRIWFATKTLIHLWKEDQQVRTFPPMVAETLTTSYLYEDAHRQLWVGTNDSLYAYDPNSQRALRTRVTSAFSLQNNLTATIHPIIPYRGDTLLMGSWYGGVHKVVRDGEHINCIAIDDPMETDPKKYIVRGMCRRQDGYYWVGTYGDGVALLDASSSRFINQFHADPENEKSLGSDYVNNVFTDASGILWVGTSLGMDKFDPLTQKFVSVAVPAGSDEFSVYRLPRSITEDRSDHQWLWITVSGVGLFHYNTLTRKFVLFHHDPEQPGSLPDNVVYTLFYDHKGRIWLGTASGLCSFDPQKRVFERITLPGSVQPKAVHVILQDNNGTYWFATSSGGVCAYDEARNETRSYTYDENNRNSLPDNRVFCMLCDHQDNIWVGTQNRGLCRLNPESGEFDFFEHNKSDPHTIPDDGIYDLYEDSQGHLWIATENGLADMDLQDFSIINYSTRDGLCNNVISAMIPDREGNLWLATYNGLSRFEPNGRTFKNYYEHDGLPTNNLSGALYCASDGVLYLGSGSMITFFQPEMMLTNLRVPPVVITNFKVFDRERAVQRNQGSLLPLDLSYHDNMITFDFAALNFTNAALNQYAYRLEGFDDQWIYCGHKQSATFTNLDGGTYVFHVKAANNDGIWNEEGATVTLIVHPPYWRTWWFYLSCALAFAGVLYGAYRFRINQLLKLQQIRTRISRDLHDDIGSTLSSINMVSSMAAVAGPDEKRSIDLFRTISSASSQAMELMSDIVWSINPKNDRMEMIIIRMRQYASEILEAAQIAFTLEVDEASQRLSLPIEHRKDFYLIFKEAVNNIAKYSGATNAVISLMVRNGRLQLQLTDNGVGFDSSAVYEGNGLKNMRARAAQLNGDIDIVSTPKTGTVIILSIPISP